LISGALEKWLVKIVKIEFLTKIWLNYKELTSDNPPGCPPPFATISSVEK
jgi:hypothetical protein